MSADLLINLCIYKRSETHTRENKAKRKQFDSSDPQVGDTQ